MDGSPQIEVVEKEAGKVKEKVALVRGARKERARIEARRAKERELSGTTKSRSVPTARTRQRRNNSDSGDSRE